jgi:hypothetical protein
MTTIVEILAWTLVWPLAALLIDRLVNPRTPERRVARLLAWYPRGWCERHGDDLAELLEDAIAGGRDDFRLTLDVAREGLVERARTTSARRIAGGFLTGLGWTMFFPQGVVAAILGQFESMPPSWFLALHVGGDELWLVAGGMVALGLLLVDRGMRMSRLACRRLAR